MGAYNDGVDPIERGLMGNVTCYSCRRKGDNVPLGGASLQCIDFKSDEPLALLVDFFR